MKTSLILLAGVSAFLLAPVTNAQQFSVTGHVVAGGGRTSQGSGFTITGTVGQPESAQRSRNNCWAIDPGFWGFYAIIPTPGAPQLSVRIDPFDPTRARVSFIGDCREWMLQVTPDMKSDPSATVWEDDDPANFIEQDGELVRNFHIPSWGPRLFFRLRSR